VAWDEPQLNVGDLLEKDILGKFLESHRRKLHDKLAKEKHTWNIVGAYSKASALKAEVS
jgi:hypothetical protein